MACAGTSLVAALDGRSVLRPFGGATVCVLLLVALSLVFRRRAPLTVAWITIALAGALLYDNTDAVDVGQIPWWPPTAPFAAYAAMAFPTTGRPLWLRGAPVVALVALVSLTPGVLPDKSLHDISGQETGSGGVMISRSLFAIVAGALLGMYIQLEDDSWIAACAITYDLPLATLNVKDYRSSI
jgi:hypothetical protein